MAGSVSGSARSFQSGRSQQPSVASLSAGRTPVPPAAGSVRSEMSGRTGGSRRHSAAESVRSGRSCGTSVRSGRTGTSAGMSLGTDRSITSTEALGKLSQLEALLDKERAARHAAEVTLRTLVTSRHPKAHGASGDATTQKQLDLVMSTLKTIITDSDYKPAHGRRAQNASSRGQHSSRSGTSSQRHRQTAARSGLTTDHRGGLHFNAPPGDDDEDGEVSFPNIIGGSRTSRQ